MSNPNKAVWNARHSNRKHVLVDRIKVESKIDAENLRDEIRLNEDDVSMVKASSRKIGPRNNPIIIHEVLVFEHAK